ncbi:MAG: hypothetical protein VKP62_14730 [Candidatus Sericytochromatia bacterium]|nr:hypothetical protein [Candidatus Sericytochromatia bacterium]
MRILASLLAALSLGACAQAPTPLAAASNGLEARASSRQFGWRKVGEPGVLITPEGVESAARARAAEWAEDAELRFVAWGLVKVERLSAVNHSFFSPSRRSVLVVATFLSDQNQRAVEYSQPDLVKPMDVLKPLGKTLIDANRAVLLAQPYFIPGNNNPLRMVTLTHPSKFIHALWSVAGGGNLVHVNAETGTVLGIMPVETKYPAAWRDQRR